ncbi:Trichodiene oxygenase 7 [Colletotrichum musicola]|uniref:Trichodiene oxygenase 7 n=1 Tax=Colletotrichum musicola TaxID=2175873 RepID=A0A8H6KP62_9PEZI|nr:Trichodiene oxygenase 7 [Colletotrichum musicola]
MEYIQEYLTFTRVFLFLTGVFFCYWTGVYIYRVTWHPLAKFPGTKLAAMSFWYEFYYDLWPHRCRYMWKIKALHDEYGPIVRINPIHIHIYDADYLDEIYAGGKHKRDRDPWFMHMSKSGVMTWSLIHTQGHEVHKQRRAALAPFFSRRAIAQLDDMIGGKIETLAERLSHLRVTGDVIDLTYVMSALAMDVVSSYALGADVGNLQRADWGKDWLDAHRTAGYIRPMGRQFKWLVNPALMWLSPSLVEKFSPRTADLSRKLMFPMESIQAAAEERERGGGKALEANTRTIFSDILDSDLPEHEKLPGRLSAEAAGILGAGNEGTARTLAITLFYIYDSSEVLGKLRDELKTIMPLPTSRVSLEALEALPYFSASMTEGLRLSHGASSRMPRIATDENLIYRNWVIPAGTPVMQSMYLHHTNPRIFPQPFVFLPQRWIEKPELKSRYFLAWGRGSRSCVGMKLVTPCSPLEDHY